MTAADATSGIPRDVADDILRRRAESLAAVQVEIGDEDREEVLLFAIGDETYGVGIGEVREILNEYAVTPIPCVPDYIAGVIQIRGETVSVTDLASLMGVGARQQGVDDDGELRPLIVIADGPTCTALAVDSIGDILDVPAGSIEPPLAVADKVQSDLISGGFYESGRLVALVNTSKVLTPVGGE